MQQEYLGAPLFIENPNLGMSSLKNYDLRLDYTPYEGGLVSLSWFNKDIDDPIEYRQRLVNLFSYTTAENYPSGTLDGWEFEVRQKLGQFYDDLDGLSLGANITWIDAEVRMPQDEVDAFADPSVDAPRYKRDMLNAPEYLYNLFLTYDIERTGTKFALFYTVQGDTLVEGAGATTGQLIPDVYAKEIGSLNFSLSQKLGEVFKLGFKAKNLNDPTYREVYRSHYINSDVTKIAYSKGIDYSISLTAEFKF
jgi:hypothetical protein